MAADLTELIDASEVARRVGITGHMRSATQLKKLPGFPEPTVTRGRTAYWLREEVERWCRARETNGVVTPQP